MLWTTEAPFQGPEQFCVAMRAGRQLWEDGRVLQGCEDRAAHAASHRNPRAGPAQRRLADTVGLFYCFLF